MVRSMRNLFSTAVIASLFSAVANTLWMLYESGGGRIRDAGLPRLVRFAGIVLDHDPARLLPDLFQRYQDLTQWSVHFPFLLAAAALNVAFGVVAALLAAAPLLLWKGSGDGKIRGRRTWMCVALAVLCVAPVVTLPAGWVTRSALELAHWRLVALAVSGAILALCAAEVFLMLRGPAGAPFAVAGYDHRHLNRRGHRKIADAAA